MFKPMILVAMTFSTFICATLILPKIDQKKPNAPLVSPHTVTLNCIVNPTVYIDTVAGIWIRPSDLASFSSAGCPAGSLVAQLRLGNSGPFQDSINVGCNAINGPLNMTVRVTDCNDTEMCNAVLMVRDTMRPDITCPKDTVVCNINNAPPVLLDTDAFEDAGGTLTDNCFPPPTVPMVRVDTSIATCGKVIRRTYKITDYKGLVDSCFHHINIPDTLKLNCPSNMVQLFTNGSVCHDTFVPIKPTAHSSCGLATLVHNGPVNNIYNIGTRTVTWTATNKCGDMASCSVQVRVNDNEPPSLTCRNIGPVSLSAPPQNIFASSLFISATSDGCSHIVYDSVRRMDTSCDPNANRFSKNVIFCCADVNRTIPVVVKVTDIYGNSNTCMVNVAVDDKLPPVITPLRNISVSCNYFINLNNLTPFGSIRTDAAQIQVINLADPVFQSLPGTFQDGLATDYCPIGLTVSSTFMDNRDAHNVGNIVRRFTVTDGRGNSATTQQIITVVDTDSLEYGDIIWPADTTYTDCSIDKPTPAMTGSPTVPNDDICTIVGISHKDLVFDDPTSGCKYIMRTWKVIDWAKFVPNTNKGVFEYVQDIHLINKIKPTITSPCANVVQCTPNAACNATFTYRIRATDDCTDSSDIAYRYSINTNNDGGIAEIVSNGRNISQLLERGTHSITVMAEDRCGNVQQCSFLVTIKDCKAPNGVMLNGLAADIGQDGQLTIWATDFNNYSSDNCTPANLLRYSFSGTNVLETSKTYDCDDIGNQAVSIYVYDIDGNVTRVNTFIDIQDNFNRCPSNGTGGGSGNQTIRIAGKVATENQVYIPDTKISISNGTSTFEVMSDIQGSYTVEGLPMYGDYNILPERNQDWMNGISTLDMVLIQRHILQIERLNSPYKLIAGDVNNDAKISVKDIVELRKLLLGATQEVIGGKSWRFIHALYQFQDPQHPWPFEEDVKYEKLDVNMSSSDFIAIKSGDVNGSVAAFDNPDGVSSRSVNEFNMELKDEAFEADKIINIPIYSKDVMEMEAIQMSIVHDPSYLEFVGILPEAIDISIDEYASLKTPQSNLINIVKADFKPWKIDNDRVLFTLQFKTKQSGILSRSLTLDKENLNAIAYDANDEKYFINMRYTAIDHILDVEQNSPNPFKESSCIKFTLNEDSPVEVKIYNNIGSMMYNNYRLYPAGVHQILLNDEILQNSSGVFYIHIESAEETKMVKAIRIQ